MNWKFFSVAPVTEVSVFNYPKTIYKAYWETHVHQQLDGVWVAEVRFLGYNGYKINEIHSVTGPTETNVNSLVQKLITEKINSFRK